MTWSHPWDGIVRLLNMGSDGHPAVDDPLYRRSLYSSATLPMFEPGWVDQGVGPLGGQHRGRLAGVERPDSGAERSRWLAQGRDVVDHVVAVVNGAEVHVARCSGVVGIPVTVGGWHAPDGVASFLGMVTHDGGSDERQRHDCPDTALGSASAERYVVVRTRNELRICWVTGLGAAADGLDGFVDGLDVEWRDEGAVLRHASGVAVAAFVTGRRLWPAASAGQNVHRWG